uniref:Uncharacterized protein AlNc14C227G9233 n=1 Tax=Albugo laibachii Nc14 TaxID=890382 RepID=F0WS94_9STRA|nr:conserved hypothetical protein [Albugo laibachii Nc14]CCA26935.1 conserved hypothetical protein [Albugo laibachii Nc14]|eukprot:CCA26935.1 conserved hypothetical protein [Albugo laibachii Nc14]
MVRSLDTWLFGEEQPVIRNGADCKRTTATNVSHVNHMLDEKSACSKKGAAFLKKAQMLRKNVETNLRDPLCPAPISSRLRKLFGSERMHQRQNRAFDEKAVKIRSPESMTLRKIVRDPNKLPFLLEWLALAKDNESHYHQVVLFLLEIEQLHSLDSTKKVDQAHKIWSKYLRKDAEFDISGTLQLTIELKQLVWDHIKSGKVSFYPIQKLAYTRLSREELPMFVQSREYYNMVMSMETKMRSIPMEQLLQQPRAAHYFLLYLMQSRQHFELYFWLHVEYVLLPALESNEEAFWNLSHVLVQKCLTESKAITMITKQALQQTLESKEVHLSNLRSEPLFKRNLIKAQQEIFMMLGASWYDRFCKSNLYKIVLRDPLLTWAQPDDVNDGFTELMSHQSSQDVSGLLHVQNATYMFTCEDVPSNDCEIKNTLSNGQTEFGDSIESPTSSDSGHFSELGLDLENIIRFTSLPEGLQVHYQPNFNVTSDSMLKNCDAPSLIEAVTFLANVVHQTSTDTHESCELEIHQVHIIQEVSNPQEYFQDLRTRLKPFLVPDGRMVISKTSKCPNDSLFFFQQTGRHGLMNAAVFLTYQDLPLVCNEDEVRRARGLSFVSKVISATTLRSLLQRYLSENEASKYMCPDRLSKHFADQIPLHMDSRTRIERCPTSSYQVNGACCDSTLEPLVQFFGTCGMLQLLACALLECSIIFVSNQYSALTICAEGIRSLLKPFQWCHVYSPILPKSLLAYLECPTPFLVGIHSHYAHESTLPKNGPYAIANTETGMIHYTGTKIIAWQNVGTSVHDEDVVYLPVTFKDTKHALDRLLNPFLFDLDSVNPKATNNRVYKAPFPESKFRRECRILIDNLLQGHMNSCLIVGDVREFVVIFDEAQFLALKSTEESTFYRMLLRTQCFSEYIGTSSTTLQAIREKKVLS